MVFKLLDSYFSTRFRLSCRQARIGLVAALGIGILAGTGCADSGPVGLKWAVPRTPAQQQRRIVLMNYFEFNPSHTSPRYHLPAGRYVAGYEDNNAIYFPAPGKILEKRLIGTFPLDGGLYLTKSPPHQLRLYCAMQPGESNPIETFPLPSAFLNAEGRYWSVEPPLSW